MWYSWRSNSRGVVYSEEVEFTDGKAASGGPLTVYILSLERSHLRLQNGTRSLSYVVNAGPKGGVSSLFVLILFQCRSFMEIQTLF